MTLLFNTHVSYNRSDAVKPQVSVTKFIVHLFPVLEINRLVV